MKTLRYMTLDLEFEQPCTRIQDSMVEVETIIQVGVCFYEIKQGEFKLLEAIQYDVYYPFPISKYIKTLTNITDKQVNESTNSLESIKLKIAERAEFHSVEPYVIEWGFDFRALYGRVYSKEDKSKYYFKNSINIKPTYQIMASVLGFNPQGGLSKSLTKIGGLFKCLKINGKNEGAHNATVDAYNTALMFHELQKRIIY